MPWPLSQDYNEAIQTPAQCFTDDDLRQGEAVTDTLGLPIPCSGNFADVYAVASGQQKWAVKCFTRQISGLRERYAEISKYLQQVQLPFMVEFKYLDQGIRVRGQWYPILKMQWVEGLALNAFARANLENTSVLQSVCQIWLKLAARLREANLAHGDLQHGNVIIVPGQKAGTASIKLVDYDGLCVPALELLKATEVGHPSYQHPQRLREATYGLHIDNFSHLVIYTALKVLTVSGRKLWERYDNGDNLLFSQSDFVAPNQSALFKELLTHGDAEVRKLAAALAEAVRLPVQKTPRLEDVLGTASRPKTAIPKQAPIAEPSPFATSNTSPRARQKRGSKGVVAAVLVGCLMVGIGMGAYVLIHNELPPSTPIVVSPPTKPNSPRATALTQEGTILLEVEPEGASVQLDLNIVSGSATKVLKLAASKGRHELRISKEGYKPYMQHVEVTGGETRTVKVILEPLVRIVYLDDLVESDSWVGHGTLGKHGKTGYGGDVIKVREKEQDHSLSTHPPRKGTAWVAYNKLDGRYTEFKATVGILGSPNNNKANFPPLVFSLIGDGKELWKSRPLPKNGDFQDCRVSLVGVNALHLRVYCSGENVWAFAVWANPMLTLAAESK